MRRIFSVFLVVFAVCGCVFATGLESLRLGTGNDLFSLAVTSNYDDQLSFNGFAQASVWGHDISLFFDSYTKRYSNRLDVLSLSCSKSVGVGDFTFKPELGAALAGNLMFQSAQNILHEMIDVPPVEIEYDYGLRVFPIVNAEASWSTDLADGLWVGATADLDNVLGLQCMQTLTLDFGLSDVLGLSVGYRFHEAWESSDTLSDFERYSNGIYASLSVDGGFVDFGYYGVIGEGFGFGSIGVDVMALFEEPAFESEDISFTMGKTFLAMGELIPSFKQFSLTYSLNENLSIFVDDTYESGCTMIVADDYSDATRTQARRCRKFCFVTAGVEYEFNVCRFFNPSVMAGIGILYTRAECINYVGVDTAQIYNEKNATSFVANVRVQVPILPKDWLKVAKSCINASVFGGCYLVPDYERVSVVLGSNDGSGCHASLFTPYWGFLLDISIDG